MWILTHTLAGTETTINIPERRDDLDAFYNFLARTPGTLAADTEGTGLDIFGRGHALRLFQIGTATEAWVIRSHFRQAIVDALSQDRRFVFHNATFDALVLDRHVGYPAEDLLAKSVDTRILGHLLEPRTKREGGTGLRLEDLATVYVDPSAPDIEKGLHAEFDRLGLTKTNGYALIPVDNEMYNRYSGLDVLLTSRVLQELEPFVNSLGMWELAEFEYEVQSVFALMERRGIRVDVDYTRQLSDDLQREAGEHAATARRYGVENINSTAQVAEALIATGESLTATTPTGKLAVGKEVINPLADLSPKLEKLNVRKPNPLAFAVVHAKRNSKWDKAYAQAFLSHRDAGDRIHAKINPLQARTARMSIASPPLQQLPSGDWRVRRALIADPGQVIVAADYSAIEMRVLAALADVPAMRRAIENGEDIHEWTARLVLGDAAWEALSDADKKRARGLYKGVGFGKVYGGGAATLSQQTGAPIDAVRGAISAYDRELPEIRRYSRRLQYLAEHGKREVVTPIGRHLPLDRDRLYSATNYVVQSTARDLFVAAVLDLHKAGLGDALLLPVHDELVAQAPVADAEEFVREMARVMSTTFGQVPIDADPDVYGTSWGHGYACKLQDGLCITEGDHPRKVRVAHALATAA